MPVDNESDDTWLGRAMAMLRSVRSLASGPRARPWLLAGGAATFLVLAFSAFRSLPESAKAPALWPVVALVFLTAPATVLCNAVEYSLIAKALGHRVPVRRSINVTLAATLANYLPAPGGIAVRTAALKKEGTSVRAALWMNGIAAMLWLGSTAVLAGTVLVWDVDLRFQATVLMVCGMLVLLVGSVSLLRRTASAHLLVCFVAVEVAVALASGARVYLSLLALGATASFGAALSVSTSTVLAAAVGIAPAGLGIRESLAGVIGPAVGIPVAVAVAASAVDRVASQVGLALTALAAGVRIRDLRRPRTVDADQPTKRQTPSS